MLVALAIGTGCADRESPSLAGHDSAVHGDDRNGDAGGPDNGDAGTTSDADSAEESAEEAGTAPVCVSSFGDELTTSFGRLDGTLVGIVRPQDKACTYVNATHVVLEVRVDGENYAMVVNVQSDDGTGTYFATKDEPLPGAGWSEGWHTDQTLSYQNDLGLHSEDFTSEPTATLVHSIVQELTIGDTISVYATGYGPDGAHDVHKQFGYTHDGAIIVGPQSATPRVLAFRFDDSPPF